MAKEAAAKPAAKPMSKNELIAAIAASTNLSKKDVAAVVDALGEQIKAAFTKKGSGVFVFPGLFKITKKEEPKKPAQKHKWVPMLQDYRDIPAKPAYCKPKLTALKALKDIVKNGK
ncbi:MAG: HU family DNA-binding protein [Thermoguttaceae bacterium]|nr:HU family DNA-binding protein [Thermoguttaceae bacterium]